MSKWTLQKILDCEEIKFGTIVRDLSGQRIVVTKESKCFTTISDKRGNRSWDGHCDVSFLSFFRPDGTEILPPKEKVMKKFYLYSLERGKCSKYFHSEDLKTYWNGTDEVESVISFPENWTRISCFIEKEVEA